MSLPVLSPPSHRAKGVQSWAEFTRWGSSVDDYLSKQQQAYADVRRMIERLTNRTTESVVVGAHATTHLPSGADPLTTAAAGVIQPDDVAAVGTANAFARSDHKHAITTVAPTIALGSAASEGVATTFIRSDATLAAFDTTVPADLASAAAVGTAVFATRQDHVHRFPTTLMEYVSSRTLALSASGANLLLTPSVANVLFAGTFAPSGAGRDLGTAGNRWDDVRAATLNLTGGATVASLTVSGTASLGDLTANSATITTICEAGDLLADTRLGLLGGSFFIYLLNGDTLTADRNLTLSLGNAARTLTLSGDPTLGDWFDQSVKTTATPLFEGVKLDDDASAFTVELDHNGLSTTLTADRILTFDVDNASRTLKIKGTATVSQNYHTDGTPQFARLGLGAAADGTSKLRVDDSITAPSTTAGMTITNRYGGDTNVCGDPSIWLRINIGGTAYAFPGYATGA